MHGVDQVSVELDDDFYGHVSIRGIAGSYGREILKNFQPKCLSSDECIMKIWYIHTPMEF